MLQPMVVDDSLTSLDSMFMSAGRRGLEIELAPTDFIKLTGAKPAPIGRES